MSEEQMNGLIEVLKEMNNEMKAIRAELQILGVSQPNRKYMRRLLEIRADSSKCESIIEEYEQKIDVILESGQQDSYQHLIDSYNKKINTNFGLSEKLFEEEERLEDLLSDDIDHNNGYLKLEDN